MIEETDVTVLPEDGIISVKDLAKMLGMGVPTLINGLSKQEIPYIKLTKFHRHWMIRLRDLKPKESESRVREGAVAVRGK